MRDDFSLNATERSGLVRHAEELMRVFRRNDNTSSATTWLVGDISLRLVSQLEIDVLEKSGCQSNDWTRVAIGSKRVGLIQLDLSDRLKTLVSQTNFSGSVILIISDEPTLQKAPYARLPSGVHGCSSVTNCIIAVDTAKVHRCTILADTFIDRDAVVFNCGSLSCRRYMYESLQINVGPETGGVRPIVLQPEATMIDVGDQLLLQRGKPSAPMKKDVPAYNIISTGCLVRDTSSVIAVFMHPGSSIQGASCVENCVLFNQSSIKDGSTVRNVFLQWNCSISGNSSVETSVLMEEASVGPSSVVASSILGPDVHVSAGEIHSSVLGPNCNAHHQSLLIGVVWPTGRGNVGYGANVGSNHTGRIPDQECWAGEGLFWGLSCVVKFPVDLSCAPYTIVAAGSTLTPQRCTMPFSLIVSNQTGGSSIIPGWLLRSSPYTIVRSEAKFSKRRKARRHLHYTGWKILRPQTIEMCVHARAALRNPKRSSSQQYRSNKDIDGIGDNELSEKGRLAGIQAYTDTIQLFALRGFLDWAESQSTSSVLENALSFSLEQTESKRSEKEEEVSCPPFPWDVQESPESLWTFQRSLLASEFDQSASFATLLKKLVSLESDLVARIYKSKQRDDIRGSETIPTYNRAHVLADQDPVIVDAKASLEKTKSRAKLLISTLKDAVVARSKL